MSQQQRVVRRARLRGAAMVEGVVVLPVFIILFFGIFYMRDQVLTYQAVETRARSCAWQFASNGCEEMPPGCRGVVKESTFAVETSSELKDKMDAMSKDALSAGDADGFVKKVVQNIIDPKVIGAFTRAARSTPEASVTPPALFGKEPKVIRGYYQLSCNIVPTKPLDLSKDIWKLARGKK